MHAIIIVRTLLAHTYALVVLATAWPVIDTLAMVINMIGFYFKSSYKVFITLDIDECTENTDGCGEICINTVGSFMCDCRTGHQLSTNNRTCQG